MAATQARLNQISDLVTQWEQIAGYAVQDIPQWAIDGMANNDYIPVNTLFDVGMYMLHYVGDASWQIKPQSGMTVPPWAIYGMTSTAYAQRVASFNDEYFRLTGQSALTPDLLNRALAQEQGQMTAGGLQSFLMAQDNVKSTYGWLKFGLDFQQFQQQKQQMLTQFGRQLSDQEAVTQLTYLHAAQGPNMSAAVQPTFTQTTKKAAQTGMNQSVVR